LRAPLNPDEEAADRLFAAEGFFLAADFVAAPEEPLFDADRAFVAEAVFFEAVLVAPREALRAVVFEPALARLPAFEVLFARVAPAFDVGEAVRFEAPAARRDFDAAFAGPLVADPEARRADVRLDPDAFFAPRPAEARATNLKKRLVCPDPISSWWRKARLLSSKIWKNSSQEVSSSFSSSSPKSKRRIPPPRRPVLTTDGRPPRSSAQRRISS
jgi:hypothetical protein